MKICVAGQGAFGQKHLDALKRISGVEVVSLIGSAFLGAESHYLLGLEKKGVPVRQALRRFGDLIRIGEGDSSNR